MSYTYYKLSASTDVSSLGDSIGHESNWKNGPTKKKKITEFMEKLLCKAA
jgi:hypothetical protein